MIQALWLIFVADAPDTIAELFGGARAYGPASRMVDNITRRGGIAFLIRVERKR